jgi:hypothetical protein
VDIPIVVVTVPHEEDEELGVRGEGWQTGYDNFKFRCDTHSGQHK